MISVRLPRSRWVFALQIIRSIGWKRAYPLAREIEPQVNEPQTLNREAVEHALREVVSDLDSGLGQAMENLGCTEQVDQFVAEYNKANHG